MKMPVRRLTLMAGAIDDDCLTTEFEAAAAKIGTISALASMKDTVLSRLFPLGNFVAGILTVGHPWWHAAIGHCGPAQAWPGNFEVAVHDSRCLELSTTGTTCRSIRLRFRRSRYLDVPGQGTAEPEGAQRAGRRHLRPGLNRAGSNKGGTDSRPAKFTGYFVFSSPF